MTPPWEVAMLELTLVPPRVRNPTIRFFIPNGMKKPEFASILEKFRLQNPPLRTSGWTAWKQDAKGDGIFYHVSVDQETVAQI